MKRHRKKIALVAALVIATAVFLAPIAVRDFNERLKLTRCLHNAKSIGLACKLYAADHNGKYPPRLEDLAPDYLPNLDVVRCPLTSGNTGIGYDYFGGTDTDPPDKVLLRSHVSAGGRRAVVYSDVSGRVVREK